MQLSGPSCWVSPYPVGQLPCRPRGDTQLAKYGFEHFKINNILIIPNITIYSRLLVKIMPTTCANAWSKSNFIGGLPGQICFELPWSYFCTRQFGPNISFWVWKAGTIHTPAIIDSSLVRGEEVLLFVLVFMLVFAATAVHGRTRRSTVPGFRNQFEHCSTHS